MLMERTIRLKNPGSRRETLPSVMPLEVSSPHPEVTHPNFHGIRGGSVFFTSFDCAEPPHVHVEREAKTCKFWLSH